ncbi:MAG: RNA methyltransferase [Balneolia bacterium]|nr:RNA methyltransferase [Balneolia bacterium]
MDVDLKRRITEHLKDFATPDRYERMLGVLENRTSYLSVILEDIYQPHNASAVMRSCDCYGVQHVYSVENNNTLDISSGVTMKAHQWLSLHRYKSHEDNLQQCINDVREKGYLIAATSPHTDDVLLDELPLDRPVALMFGTEKEGITPRALEMADIRVRIPMYGFSESLNISVSAAICLYQTVSRLRKKFSREELALDEDEKTELLYKWLKQSVRRSALIEEKFLSGIGK